MHTKSWSGYTNRKGKKIDKTIQGLNVEKKQLGGRGYIQQSTPLTVCVYGEVQSRSLNMSSQLTGKELRLSDKEPYWQCVVTNVRGSWCDFPDFN